MSKISIFLFSLLFTINFVNASSYPAHWWAPIEDKNAPAWEILPQEGKTGKTLILSKRNELGILSNFAATPITYQGKSYASLEGAWQSMKYPESAQDLRYGLDKLPHKRGDVEKMTAHDAKRAGSFASKLMKKHGVNWVSFNGKKMTYRTKEKGEHYKLIKNLMKLKLEQNSLVRKVLLSTGSLSLLPDHHTRIDSPPAWKYNHIWMDFRESLTSQNSLKK